MSPNLEPPVNCFRADRRSSKCRPQLDIYGRSEAVSELSVSIGEKRLVHDEYRLIGSWLTSDRTPSPRYHHVKYAEIPEARETAIELLRRLAKEAHSDAVAHVISLIEEDPLEPVSIPARKFISSYPSTCHQSVLKGYFGELLAGLLAEESSPLGIPDWIVPAFLFRFDLPALGFMDRWLQTGERPTALPGRSGDDCLAFKVGDDDLISHILVCESKCTSDHRPSAISDAHEEVSEPNLRPTSIPQLIEILKERTSDRQAQVWVHRLRLVFLDEGYERCDFVCYVCGRSPVIGSCWIDKQKPHPKYVGKRRLEAVEAHLTDVNALIDAVYRGGE